MHYNFHAIPGTKTQFSDVLPSKHQTGILEPEERDPVDHIKYINTGARPKVPIQKIENLGKVL